MTFRSALLVGVALTLLPGRALTDTIGAATPSTPAAIEVAAPSVPFVVRQETADVRLGRTPRRSEAVAPRPTGDRTVELARDPTPVVNQTPYFVFVDQTDRPEPRIRSMPERQAAVEAVRQSLRLPEGH
jgi:hypothetical protein